MVEKNKTFRAVAWRFSVKMSKRLKIHAWNKSDHANAKIISYWVRGYICEWITTKRNHKDFFFWIYYNLYFLSCIPKKNEKKNYHIQSNYHTVC